jgi:hypothetical protein
VKSYLVTVSKDFNAEEESAILRMLQAVAVPVLGNVCHVFMNGLNRVQVSEFAWHLMFHDIPGCFSLLLLEY